MKKIIFIFIFVCVSLPNLRAKEYELNDKDFEDIVVFSAGATVGIIFHEIGHLVIDEFQIPIFNNEEDVADSFMAWYLIHVPEDYLTDEDYRIASEGPHRVIKYMSDYFYFLKLLGIDRSNEYNSHSTDNKRFFNIACFMKGANPEVFDSYITKRDLAYIIENEDCSKNYWSMYEAWWNIFENNWEIDLDKIEQKIFLKFEESEDDIFNYFNIVAEDLINEYLKSLQIKLKNKYFLSFEFCNGDKNAYYLSKENKILFCYDLVEEFMDTRMNVILLKNNL